MANLVTNSDFSIGTTGWAGIRGVISRVSAAAEGIPVPNGSVDDWVLRVATNSGESNGQAYSNPVITVEVGKFYVVTALCYCSSSNPTSLGTALIVADGSFNTIAQRSILAEDEWCLIAVGFSSTVTSIRLQLRDGCGVGANGVCYFDAVTVNEIALGGSLYFDSAVNYQGDGSSQLAAAAPGAPGAFKFFDMIAAFSGVSSASKRNLNGTKFLLHETAVFKTRGQIFDAYNFSISSYGSVGLKAKVDLTVSFTGIFIQESPGIWYAPAEATKQYYRLFVVNGVMLHLNNSKSDLETGCYKSWYDSVNNRHYIVLNGLINPNDCTITANDHTEIRRAGISIQRSYGWHIDNVHVQYGAGNCIEASGIGDGWSITNCNALGSGGYDASCNGIVVYGSGYNGTCVPATNGIISGNFCAENINNGIELWGVTGALLTDNDLPDNSGGIELWGRVVDSSVLRNRVVGSLNEKSTRSAGSRGIWGTATATASPNTGYNSGNTIAYNVVGWKYSRSLIIEQGTGWNVWNNTLLPCTGQGLGEKTLSITNASANLSNNIVLSEGADDAVYIGSSAGNVTLTGNNNCIFCADGTPGLYFNGERYSTFAAFKTAVSQSGTINADPLLKDVAAADCYLQPGSPCIGAGIDVGLVADYNGNQVPKTNGLVSIGAHEDYPGPKDGYTPWVNSTGTITLTPIKHGYTATPVAYINRVVQSTKELTGKQVEKYLTTATINAWRDENGKYIQVERT